MTIHYYTTQNPNGTICTATFGLFHSICFDFLHLYKTNLVATEGLCGPF